jgi:hypothetical protein
VQRTVAQIKAEMQKTLRWILPIAENTIRAHQGFGWVGEWANLGLVSNRDLLIIYLGISIDNIT